MERLVEESISSLVNPHIGERILDVGCGEGNHLLLFERRGFPGREVAQDVQDGRRFTHKLRWLVQHGSRIESRNNLIAKLPQSVELDDLTMDLVTEMHLHLDVDVNSALREIYTMQNEVGEYELSFMERYGFKLTFTQEAFAELVKKAIAQDVSALRVCENMSKEFDYAFRLIKERTGKQEFTLDAEAVRETQTYLNNLIKKYYSESASRHDEAGEPGNA